MRTSKSNHSAGFTLLEVMVAIAILAVSLLAIYSLQSTSLLGSARAQRISVCTQLARLKMDQALIEIEAGIAKGEFPEEKEEAGTFEEDKYPDYGWRLKIKKVEIPVPPAPEGVSADIMTQVFTMVSEQLSQATREVKLTIVWRGEDDEEEEGITLTTHVVKM
ncbi:MAG TPA: prepilin-type N-terminal cleavage/methylation domain-containing protein [bacterium]|nr:prepilin-type N-terminal cleavage/methylation domain-containing protein [bacterium]